MSEEFTVNDRRLFTREGRLNEESRTEEEASKDEAPEPQEREPSREAPLDGEEIPEAAAPEQPRSAGPQPGPGPLPGPTFPSLLVGLATSALIHLGESPEPGAPASPPDLPAAKQVIDLLGLLKTKTQGNLENEEEALLETLLYDLRLKFVKASQ